MRAASFDDICNWFRERQELFLDGELSGAENFRFQQHLKDCDDCAQYWAEDESLSESLMLQMAQPIATTAAVDAEDYQPRIPRIGEERRISHHSTTFVMDRGPRLIFPALMATAAGLLACLSFFGGWPAETPERPLPIVTELARATGDLARIYPQGSVEVRRTGGAWRALESVTDLEADVEIRTASDSRILVDLGDHDHFVLSENSMGRLERGAHRIGVELLQGSFSCDFAQLDFRVLATGLEINGSDSAFDLRTGSDHLKHDFESRIAVTRGELQARSDVGGTRTLIPGDIFAVRDGRLVAFDRFEPDVGDAMLAIMPRKKLGLGVEHLPTDLRPQTKQALALPLGSVSAKIEEWLEAVVASGGLNLVDPDPESRLIMDRVAIWGESILPEISQLFERAEDSLVRRALLALVASIEGDSSQAFLMAAAQDPSLSVRKASLFCLSRRTETVPAAHFVGLMKTETDTDLRLSAAFLAASLGESSGLATMRQIHELATSNYWRQTVIVLTGRLHAAFPGREDFLLSALESWQPSQGQEALTSLLRFLGQPTDLGRYRKALQSKIVLNHLDRPSRQIIEASLAGL